MNPSATDSELFDQITARGTAGDPDGAAAACDALVARLADSTDPGKRDLIARALFNKGTVFRQAGRVNEAVSAFDEVLSRFRHGPEPGVLIMAAMAQFNKGIALYNDGQAVAAQAVFYETGEVFGDSQIPEIRQRVAAALLLRAQSLRETPEQAISAYNDFLLRFANVSDPQWQGDVATALAGKGLALGDAHRYEEAVVVFDSVPRRFGDSSDAAVRQPMATALYYKGFVLTSYAPLEAEASFDELIRRFGQDGSPAISELVERARQARDKLKSSPPAPDPELRKILLQINYQNYSLPAAIPDQEAADHALHDPFEAATAAELAREWERHAVWPCIPPAVAALLALSGVIRRPRRLPSKLCVALAAAAYGIFWYREIRRARQISQYREEHLRLVASRSEDARQLHRIASSLLTLCRQQGRPFCLFLRNFDLEAYVRSGHEPDGEERLVSMSLDNSGPIERKLAAALTSRMPVIGIANPSIIRPDYRHAIPKLELPNDTWRESLAGLVRDAALIVMHLSKLSPGVSVELGALMDHRKNNQTVILIPKPESAGTQPDPFETAMSSYFGLPTQSEILDKSNPQLAQFPRVVYEEEVPFELLDLSPAFRDLLKR
jgi:tetratricopeptide (TPR) repeat protein